jgi:hypothetical protein
MTGVNSPMVRLRSRMASGRQSMSAARGLALWRLSRDGRSDCSRLAQLKGSQAGRRGFIIGNGPSLLLHDLRRLRTEATIGCNGLFLAFEEADFRPQFYVVEDHLVAEDRAAEIAAITSTTKLFPADLQYVLGAPSDAIFLPFRRTYSGPPRFSTDLARAAYWGGTVTYLSLQLAYHLGWTEVVMIGIDHSYRVPAGAGTVITSSEADANHFHPDYFGPGYRWHDPQVDRMELAYRRAKLAFESAGRSVVNATRGGFLDVFPRADLDQLLDDRSGYETAS